MSMKKSQLQILLMKIQPRINPMSGSSWAVDMEEERVSAGRVLGISPLSMHRRFYAAGSGNRRLDQETLLRIIGEEIQKTRWRERRRIMSRLTLTATFWGRCGHSCFQMRNLGDRAGQACLRSHGHEWWSGVSISGRNLQVRAG